MAIESWPHVPSRHWRARELSSLARRALALTVRGYWAGLLGPSATRIGLSVASKLNHAAIRHLRRRRVRDEPLGDRAFDPQSRYVLKRLLLKLALLGFAALMQAQAPWGLRLAVTALAVFSALISVGLAAFWRERPIAATLNYWYEAMVFVAAGVAAQWLP